MAITQQLKRVTEERSTLDLQQAQSLTRHLLAGEASEMEIAALLGAIAARGETAEEIAGFALAMREAATMLPLSDSERETLVDSCGTGGDGAGTFNISTGAALVAAAAGARVAKHGNRAVTSRCGSADVLEALGIPIALDPQASAEQLRKHGFCFLLASAHHPGMRAVMPVRRGLGIRTIFNLLGPLLNPAGARRQVMGVFSAAVVRPVAEAMPLLGIEHALVVHGAGHLDELAISGESQAMQVRANGGGHTLTAVTIRPEELGLFPAPPSSLAGGASAQENASILQAIFGGEDGPRRDVVVLNAAAVLLVADCVADLAEGTQLAAQTVRSGAVARLVTALAGR